MPFFSAVFSFPQPKMRVKCLFITNLVRGKVEKENHIRTVQKSEERKVKKLGKFIIRFLSNSQTIRVTFIEISFFKVFLYLKCTQIAEILQRKWIFNIS